MVRECPLADFTASLKYKVNSRITDIAVMLRTAVDQHDVDATDLVFEGDGKNKHTLKTLRKFAKGALVLVPWSDYIQWAFTGSVKGIALERDNTAFPIGGASVTVGNATVEFYVKPALQCMYPTDSKVVEDIALAATGEDFGLTEFQVPFWTALQNKSIDPKDVNMEMTTIKVNKFTIAVLKNSSVMAEGVTLTVIVSQKRKLEQVNMDVTPINATEPAAEVGRGGGRGGGRGRGRAAVRGGGRR